MAAYDRVHLSELFSSHKEADHLLIHPPNWYSDQGIELHTKARVERIDPLEHRVHLANGHQLTYERLVLATGSRVTVPDIPGIRSARVHVYRSVEDLEQISQHARPGLRVAVLGAGLLGIELAAAIRERGCEVELIEQAPRLLPRHLDADASQALMDELAPMSIEVRSSVQVDAVYPMPAGIQIELIGGASVYADMLVVTTGVRPRDELAREAGIACDRHGGVIVDDALETSAPDVFAIGECVNHRGRMYGQVAPGYAMAEVLASRLEGGDRNFEGTPFSARLKVQSVSVSMMGESESGDLETRAVVWKGPAHYRRVLLRAGRIIGATAVGEWSQLSQIQAAIGSASSIRWVQERRFLKKGDLFGDSATKPIASWPDAATVCSCTGVTCGALRAAYADGCRSVEKLAMRTGASRVCGSCSPLLAELCGERALPSAPSASRSLVAASVLGLVAFLVLLLANPIPLARSVIQPFPWDILWRDGVARQLTGYAVVLLAVASLTLTVRKRVRRFSRGSYGFWRSTHAVLGVGALAMVGLHTGMQLGEHMNRALLLCFLGVAVLGSASGLSVALERRLHPYWGGRLRRGVTLGHLLTLSPFVVLLGFHVFKVYYF